MKLLLFSDLHASSDAARKIVERSRGVDVVVGAGDFGNVRRMLQGCVDILSVIRTPTVLVAGNNESTEELVAACKSWPAARVLHGSAATIDGVTFFGLGGGVPITPFGSWSYDLSEEQAARLLARCPEGCVLVSHSPPKGAVDVASNGQSLGSTVVRDCILVKKPALVVCGHIHASGGTVAGLDGVPVVNAGPAGVTWELSAGGHPNR